MRYSDANADIKEKKRLCNNQSIVWVRDQADYTFVYCCTCAGSKPVNMTRGVDSGGSFLLGDWISSSLHTHSCTFHHNINHYIASLDSWCLAQLCCVLATNSLYTHICRTNLAFLFAGWLVESVIFCFWSSWRLYTPHIHNRHTIRWASHTEQTLYLSVTACLLSPFCGDFQV